MTVDLSELEKQYGLPSGLLSAVQNQESGGDPNAVSKAGAQGLFQFMPDTAKQYGIDPFDPDQAADGAARMYADLSKKYKGHLPSMLAAYNWGQGNVDRKGLANAPAETRNYIESIQGKLKQPLPKGTEYAAADNGIMNDASGTDDTVPIPVKDNTTSDYSHLSDDELEARIAKLKSGNSGDVAKLSDDELDAKIAALSSLPGLGGAESVSKVEDPGVLPKDNTPEVPFYDADDKPIPKVESPTDPLMLKGENSPNFIERTKEDWNKRMNKANEIEVGSTSQPYSSTLFQRGGNLIGASVIDPVKNIVGSGAQYVRDIAPETADSLKEDVGATLQDAGANLNPALKDAAGEATKYVQNNPQLARNLDAAGDISAALPFAKPAAGAIGAVDSALANAKPATFREFLGSVSSGGGDAAALPKEKLSSEMRKVYDRLRADYPDDAEFSKMLNSYSSKKDQALIEVAGNRTKNLGEGSAMYPSGGARATEFFDEAVGSAPEKLKSAVSKTVSPSTNYYDTLDDMIKAGREKAAPLYQQAFKNNPSIVSPKIDRILATPEGKSALAEAAKNMQNEMSLLAKPDKELTAMAKELESMGKMDPSPGGVGSGLKLKTLDYIKKSMDDTINKAYRAGDEAEARRIINLKKGLVDEVDAADKSGLYAKARKVSGDYLSNKQAMDSGLNFMKEDGEIVARDFKGMGPAEKRSYKTGVVKAIRTQIENAADGHNVARIFSKPATRDKLKSLLGEDDFNKLIGDARAVDNIYKLRNQMTGNSRTAMRQIASKEFDNEGAELFNEFAEKGPYGMARSRVLKMVSKAFDGMSDKSAGEVANILYEQDPKKKYQIVKSLLNQTKTQGSPARKAEASQKLQAFFGLSSAAVGKKL